MSSSWIRPRKCRPRTRLTEGIVLFDKNDYLISSRLSNGCSVNSRFDLLTWRSVGCFLSVSKQGRCQTAEPIGFQIRRKSISPCQCESSKPTMHGCAVPVPEEDESSFLGFLRLLVCWCR